MASDCYDYFKEQTEDGSLVYLFGVEGKIVYYTVSFDINLYANHLDKFNFLLQNGYGLSITSEGGRVYDKRIAITIRAILSEFFDTEDNNAFLLYHCDYKDGKQAVRNKLFHSWYTEITKDSNDYYKYSLEVEIETDNGPVKHYIGFISKNENSDKEKAIEEFEQFSVDLINENVNKG